MNVVREYETPWGVKCVVKTWALVNGSPLLLLDKQRFTIVFVEPTFNFFLHPIYAQGLTGGSQATRLSAIPQNIHRLVLTPRRIITNHYRLSTTRTWQYVNEEDVNVTKIKKSCSKFSKRRVLIRRKRSFCEASKCTSRLKMNFVICGYWLNNWSPVRPQNPPPLKGVLKNSKSTLRRSLSCPERCRKPTTIGDSNSPFNPRSKLVQRQRSFTRKHLSFNEPEETS